MDTGKPTTRSLGRLKPRTRRTSTTTAPDLASRSSSLPRLQYTPLESPKNIRLLKIAPSTKGQIVVFLEEVEIDAGIPYECLSYTWDDPKFKPSFSDIGEHWATSHKRIICNNAVTYIRQNLHDALVQLRASGNLGPIWIDALCINQDDVSERNSQVARMGTIYKGASRVTAWLGEEDEHTKPALELLKRFTLTYEEFCKDQKLGRHAYYGCNYSFEDVLTIHYFLAYRTWFSRLWIIQETLRAADLRFLCGSHSLLLETIWRGVLIIYLNPTFLRELEMVECAKVVNFCEIVGLRHEWLQNMYLKPIGYNLHVYRDSLSSDPRDKVFGLLGISDCSDIRISTRLVADYSMTPQEVYTKAAIFTLHVHKKLSALAAVGDQSRNRVIDLPSWVPDLSIDERPVSFEWSRVRYSTATKEPYSLQWNEDTLILQGFLWDQIDFSSESFSEIDNGQGVLNLLQVFNTPGSVHTYSNESLEKAIQSLFITDRLRDSSLALIARMSSEYDLEAAFETLFSSIMYFGLHKAGQMDILETFLADPEAFLRMFTKDPGTSSAFDALVSIFRRGMVNRSYLATGSTSDSYTGCESENTALYDGLNCGTDPFSMSWYSRFGYYRRFFRTSRGYLGLGIHNIRPGDSIYLIKGASVPYVFRPVSDNPADGFKLIGEVYVHGIMYGEALSVGPVNFERMEIH